MATRFHIGAHSRQAGAAALPSRFEAYAKRFDFLEVPTGGASPPAPATMRKWRKAVPPHFDFSVVAGPNLGKVKASAALERELELATAAIDALQARCFLLSTPPDVTPSALWRDRLAKLVDRLPRDATSFAWEPHGLWEIEDAAMLAKKLGIVLVVDAARDPVPPGLVAYVRLQAIGETRSFGISALERVVVAVGARRDAYVVFDTPEALKEAKLLRQVVQAGPTRDKGGMGRLVRPRGIMKVRDDEQE